MFSCLLPCAYCYLYDITIYYNKKSQVELPNAQYNPDGIVDHYIRVFCCYQVKLYSTFVKGDCSIRVY